MNKRLAFTVAILCLILVRGVVDAQVPEESKIKRMARTGKSSVSQEELVSFKSDVPYKEAIELLNGMSKKFLKKPIIDTAPLSINIGVNVESMYWRDALELILRTNGLWFIEAEDYIQVVSAGVAAATPGATVAPGGPIVAKADSGAILAKAREIVISAIFLEIDQTKLRESGISFNIFRGRDLNLGVEFQGAGRVSSDILTVTASPRSSKLAVDIDAAIRVFESEQLGEVIARPQITARSGNAGRIQIGANFSVKERDFSGNILDKFYPTGTILEVTPNVYMYGTTPLIDIQIKVERSTVQPGTVTTIINKAEASSKLILLDGEESYVGGLYVNEENVTREGIPLLKDLPWWFFGLRYIFGYDASRLARKELIVLIKAELVPTMEERAKQAKRPDNMIQKKLEEGREDTMRRKPKND